MTTDIDATAARSVADADGSRSRRTTVGALAAAAIALLLLALGAIRAATAVRLRRRWRSLAAESADGERFDPETVADLPEPARRYLETAIEPGTPLARSVEFDTRGQFKTSADADWKPLRATQVLALDRGFVWRARLTVTRLLVLSGADYFVDGVGGQAFFWGPVPVVRSSGDAVSRSSAGRFLAECVWLPTAFLPRNGAEWEAVDDDRARVTVSVGDVTATILLTVGEDGELAAAETRRFRAEDREVAPFSVSVGESRTFDGFTVPAQVTAGWGDGDGDGDGDDYEPFIDATVTDARFR